MERTIVGVLLLTPLLLLFPTVLLYCAYARVLHMTAMLTQRLLLGVLSMVLCNPMASVAARWLLPDAFPGVCFGVCWGVSVCWCVWRTYVSANAVRQTQEPCIWYRSSIKIRPSTCMWRCMYNVSR